MAKLGFTFLFCLFLHEVSGLRWWEKLSPIPMHHCPESTPNDNNICYEMRDVSHNCTAACDLLSQSFPFPFYHGKFLEPCRHMEYIRCTIYHCEETCCHGWSKDINGKCTAKEDAFECLNGGTKYYNPARCHCSTQYTGKQCETAVCAKPCQNGGICKQHAYGPYSPPQCVCPANFTGSACEKPLCGDGCLNGGECVKGTTDVICRCPASFYGDRCQKNKQHITTRQCQFYHEKYDTKCAKTCYSDHDCPQEETCCVHDNKRICVVKPEKAHQKCYIHHYWHRHSYVYVGEVTKYLGKWCRCMPGYMRGNLDCDNEECNSNHMQCKIHGNGILHHSPNHIDKPDGYDNPIIYGCPGQYSRVLVEVGKDSNFGHLKHEFRARDWNNEILQVHISQKTFKACNCSRACRQTANVTAIDSYKGATTCCFTVEVVDKIPPVFLTCPTTIYAVGGEFVTWKIPEATDNVGIRDIRLQPNIKNGSTLTAGTHVFKYIAEDWAGNSVACVFMIEVESSEIPEEQWPAGLKSRIKSDVGVIIGGSVVGILTIALLVMIAALYKMCRRKSRLLRNQRRRARQTGRQDRMTGVDNLIYGTEPPPYEVAAKDKLPEYKEHDDPPVYEDIVAGKSERKACDNPIYSISGNVVNTEEGSVKTNSIVTDV